MFYLCDVDGGLNPPHFYHSHEEIEAACLAAGVEPPPRYEEPEKTVSLAQFTQDFNERLMATTSDFFRFLFHDLVLIVFSYSYCYSIRCFILEGLTFAGSITTLPCFPGAWCVIFINYPLPVSHHFYRRIRPSSQCHASIHTNRITGFQPQYEGGSEEKENHSPWSYRAQGNNAR